MPPTVITVVSLVPRSHAAVAPCPAELPRHAPHSPQQHNTMTNLQDYSERCSMVHDSRQSLTAVRPSCHETHRETMSLLIAAEPSPRTLSFRGVESGCSAPCCESLRHFQQPMSDRDDRIE